MQREANEAERRYEETYRKSQVTKQRYLTKVGNFSVEIAETNYRQNKYHEAIRYYESADIETEMSESNDAYSYTRIYRHWGDSYYALKKIPICNSCISADIFI
jgi:tetratricopeptide (TPR) repeat protein